MFVWLIVFVCLLTADILLLVQGTDQKGSGDLKQSTFIQALLFRTHETLWQFT